MKERIRATFVDASGRSGKPLTVTTDFQKRFTIAAVTDLLSKTRKAERARVRRLVKRIKDRGVAAMARKQRPPCCCYADACEDLLTALDTHWKNEGR